MTLALFSDIHANLEALTACLRHAHEHGASSFAFLGDLVGYGASPAEVVDVVRGHAREGAVVVSGNHDVAIVSPPPNMDAEAREVIDWTRRQLGDGDREFLSSLPLVVRRDDICFVHATAHAPERWTYAETTAVVCDSIDAAQTTYTFSGHVHDQLLYFRTLAGKTAPFRPQSGSVVPVPSHRRWLGLVGSVGQPRDGNPAAAYAIFDAEREELTFYRVPYDAAAAAARIRWAGLPSWLADRVERGT